MNGKINKQQAAELIGCSTKHIERLVKGGFLASFEETMPRMDGKMAKQIVFESADTVKQAQSDYEKSKTDVRPRPQLMRDEPAVISNELMPTANVEMQERLINVFEGILQSQEELKQLVGKQLNPAPAEIVEPKKFLTVEEAADEFGLSKSYLKRLVDEKTLTKHPGKNGKTMISRRELELL